MKDGIAQQPVEAPSGPVTVADAMRPPLTTVEQDAHVAAAAYLMKHAGASALMIRDRLTDHPIGILTEADIAHAIAAGKDLNSVRIHDLMTTRPTLISTATSIRDAAEIMTRGHFRHLPVVGDSGLIGIVDVADICRVLIALGSLDSPAASFRQILASLPDVLDFSRFSYASLTGEGDQVVALIDIGVTGTDAIIKVSDHWSFRDGKATSLWSACFEPQALLEKLGLCVTGCTT